MKIVSCSPKFKNDEIPKVFTCILPVIPGFV